MFILPVLDLLHGVVVRGVAGRRETYRPVESQICDSARPLDVAMAFREKFGLDQLYVADLDAILQQRPNFDTYRELTEHGFRVCVDAGIQSLAAADAVRHAGAHSLIAGLESVPAPALLGELVARHGSEHIIFSLDLKGGQPLVGTDAWRGLTPLRIGEVAIEQGIGRLIVLDLAQVGVANGITTLNLCAQLRTRAGDLEIITGGGVRDVADLKLLKNTQIDGVLLASALHLGWLSRADLDSVSDRLILPQ